MKIATCQERLKELFEQSGKPDADIAADLNVSKQTISSWRTGARSPKRTMIETISKVFGVSIEWIMGYDVPMVGALPTGLMPISQLDRKHIPLIGSVAAGEPIFDPEFPDVVVDGPLDADFALRVKGDSMEPEYLHGDLIYLKSTPDIPHEGATVAIAIDDEATLKRVYKHPDSVTLISNNPRYAPMIYTFTDHVIRVLGIPIGYTRMFRA